MTQRSRDRTRQVVTAQIHSTKSSAIPKAGGNITYQVIGRQINEVEVCEVADVLRDGASKAIAMQIYGSDMARVATVAAGHASPFAEIRNWFAGVVACCIP